MTTSKRLAAFRAAEPAGDMHDPAETDPTRPIEDEEDETTTSNKKDKEKKPMTEELEKAKAEGHATGFKAANDRMNAVFASAEYQGREASAHHKLTAAEYAGFTAEQIIASLGKETKVEAVSVATAAAVDTEAAATAVMREAIAANVNSTIDVSGGAPEADQKMNAVDNILTAQRQFGSQAPRAQTK